MAAGLVLAGATPAFADEVVVDADTLTANQQSTRNLGDVAPGATLTAAASFGLQCTGKNHVDNGQTVTLAQASATLNGASVDSTVVGASDATIGAIPSAWADDTKLSGQTNCTASHTPQADNGDSGVTIKAPTTPGPYTVVVTWRHTLSPAGAGDSNAIAGSGASATYTFTVVAPVEETVVTPPPPPADTTAPVVSYTLNPATPDGDNDWYKTGSVVLDWTVTENESNSSLVLTGCEDRTISADQLAATYSCSARSSGGTAEQRSVTIKRDATNPAVDTPVAADVTGTAGDNGWYTSDVGVTFRGTDATSGISGDAARTVTLNADGANQTAQSPAYADIAGNTVAAGDKSVPGLSIDKTDPLVATPVAEDVSGTVGDNGWYRSAVQVTFHGSDATSGLVGAADRSVTLGTDGANQTAISPAYTDVAGNTVAAGDQTVNVNIDATAPAVATPEVSGASGVNGWYTGPVQVTFRASDATSGLADDTQVVNLTTDGSNHSAGSRAFTDRAGNTVAAGNKSVRGIKIDQTAPTNIAFSSRLSGNYAFGNVPDAPTCTAEDATSGATCMVTGHGTTVGSHTLTATATNGAGLSSTTTTTYRVDAYTTKGFHQPIDMGGVFNSSKAGSTVPLKFEAFAGATELTATNIAALKYTKLATSTSVSADEVETLATGGTSLRWDATAGQYVYNWKTPSAGSYQVTVYLNDLKVSSDPYSGTRISALVRLR